MSAARFRNLLGQSLPALSRAGKAIKVADGLRWGEGPAWFGAAGKWVFSDIPNDRLLEWNARDGLSVFRAPSEFANGNTIARDGSLLTCEHGARRITRTTPKGDYSPLCDRFEGKRLNSPNDLVEHPDGNIWFSDPTYGILTDLEGHRAIPEQAVNRVYRFEPETGVLRGEVSTLMMPNGLCFSPDLRRLYVADSGAEMGPEIGFDPAGPREVHVFHIGADGHATEPGRIFARATEGVPDGIRCDEEGYLWVATAMGVECFAPDGTHVGAIQTPEVVANLCFGGEGETSLMLALATSVYLIGPC